MKRDIIAFSVLVFVAMLMVLAMPATATDNVLYFNPDNSSVSGYCSSVDVQVMADISESNPTSATAVTITFDPSCVDITNWALDSGWNSGTDSLSTGSIQITTSVGANPAVSGSVPVGMLTLHCNDTSGCCGSWLNFTTAEYTNASDMATIVAETDDGTFLCGDGITVTKKVLDGSVWVDALGPLGSDWLNKDVIFNITVTAGCMPLSNLVVSDVMDSGLEYNGNASPGATSNTTTTATWNLGSLSASTSTSIEFNATIVGYGTSCNDATATAGVTDLGLVEVSDTDQACVTTMPPAGIEVNKTVWNPVIGQWVDVLAMQVIDELDIGDPASEAGHNLQGWGPALNSSCSWSGSGAYYGGMDGSGDLRVTWAQGNATNCANCPGVPPVPTYCSATIAPCCGDDGNDSSASFEMNNPGHAKQLQLRVLDGEGDDNFDVYVNGILAYSYTGAGGTEDWVTHNIIIPVSQRNVDPLVITVEATADPWSGICPYGQLAINWAKLYTWSQISDTHRFRCEMHNSGSPGMDLTSIVALDVLSDSLEYAGDAKIQTPNGVWRDINPPDINDPANNTVGWTIDSFLQDPLTLQPCQTVVIEFDATVVDYGYDCNNQIAMAWCEAALSDVEGNDTACIDTPKPDLDVTDITVNYDAAGVKNKAMGPLPPGTKTQSNNISADITEINGVDITDPFDVTFEIDGGLKCTVTVPSLAAGATTTVYCDNQFFPIAEVTYTITVTADSVDVIPETDEGNNDMDKVLKAMVNGYKGDGWQDGRNITNLQCHEQGTINLTYSTGDSAMYSAYNSGPWTTYTANWTPSNFSIPVTDSYIKKARLYVYYNYDKEPDGDPTDAGDNYHFNLTFNGIEQEVDAHYWDNKKFGSYDYTYGMIAYDVTDRFMVPTPNHAELTYTWPTGSFKDNSITGMLLVVVYNNTETEPDRIIWINEGYDTLYARDYYGVSSEEATTYAEFEGCEPIPMDEVVGANLITVAPHANEGGEKNKLTFNDGEWYGVWDSYTKTTELSIVETDVRTHLEATDNTAAFQSHKSGVHKSQPYPYKPDRGDSMEASNAFLVVQKARTSMTVVPDSDECYDVGEQFDVMIDIDPMGVPIRGAQFDLNYNGSVIMVDNFELGGFLIPPVSIDHQSIDNGAGVASFGASMTGGTGGATTPGTFVIVHCMAVGQGATSELDLTGVVVYDDHLPIPMPVLVDVYNSEVEVCDNAPPVAVPISVYEYNNMADKIRSKTYFDGTASYDTDGTITMYAWWFGDGATGVGPTTEHEFNVRQYWEGGTPAQGGHYIDANVTLIVTDDGMPLMDNMAHIDVIVWIGGDANGDGVVNIGDSVMIGYYWGGDSHTNPYADRADLNNDGIVNIGDSIPVGFCWGHTAW
ncbi:MAG TPA: DUF3344 domain-containing protein [Methanosarcinales archaeon]|nr:DUF3344 domain-containing protein [Methanosarcinales archaeon]